MSRAFTGRERPPMKGWVGEELPTGSARQLGFLAPSAGGSGPDRLSRKFSTFVLNKPREAVPIQPEPPSAAPREIDRTTADPHRAQEATVRGHTEDDVGDSDHVDCVRNCEFDSVLWHRSFISSPTQLRQPSTS